MTHGFAKLLRASRVFRKESSKKVETLIRQVADASLAIICERVASQIGSMSLSEARGYIRARATQVVMQETRQALTRIPEANLDWIDTIVRAATERLVPTVLHQMSVGIPQPTSIPLAA